MNCDTVFKFAHSEALPRPPNNEEIVISVREQVTALGNHIDMYNRDITSSIVKTHPGKTEYTGKIIIRIDGIFEKETSDHDSLVSTFQEFEYTDVLERSVTVCKEATM